MRSASTNHRHTSNKVEDDIASEPDIIQYRHFEFLNSVSEKKGSVGFYLLIKLTLNKKREFSLFIF